MMRSRPIPMLVQVDHDTASAAEIVTAGWTTAVELK